MVARWQLKWDVRDGLTSVLKGSKQAPRHLWNGFVAGCTGLVGLVASDNLLGFSNSPYKNQVTFAVGVAVSAIAILSRNTQWGFKFRKVVMSTIYWTFGAMALVVLKIGGESQLGVFTLSGSPLFLIIYNLLTAVFLLGGILVSIPFFTATDWTKDVQGFVESTWKKKHRVPAIFTSEFIVDERKA